MGTSPEADLGGKSIFLLKQSFQLKQTFPAETNIYTLSPGCALWCRRHESGQPISAV
jgi:hypothetical protein